MLGKLIKYEFKACGRTFFPLYIGILVLAAINGLCNNYNIFSIGDNGSSLGFSIENVQGILMLVLFALFVALFVLTILLTIQRFKKNLLDEEGYLMFTLPVSTKSLILSKYLVAIIFIVLSTLVAVVSFMFIGLFSGNINLNDIASMLALDMFKDIFSAQDLWKFILYIITGLLIMYSMFIFTVYLAISVGQFPQFNKHRIAAGIIAFFVINTVLSYIQRLINNYIFTSGTTTEIACNISFNITGYDVLGVVLNILLIVVLFMGTDWILNNKLNLE